MANETSTIGNTASINPEAIVKAMQEIDLLPRPTEWVLIDPQGNVYKGEFDAVFGVMAARHPYFGIRKEQP